MIARIYGFSTIVFGLFLFTFSNQVFAGGSGQNAFLIINAESNSSMTVGNHYADLRQIPSINILHLKGVPDAERISLEDFRTKILGPIFKSISTRKIGSQIDYIIYSTNFPTAINVGADREKLKDKIPKENLTIFNPIASINSLTYFGRAVLAGKPVYFGLDSNWYARRTYRELSQTTPHVDTEKVLYDSAMKSVAKSDFNGAVKTFAELAEQNPADPYYLILKAKAQAQSGDHGDFRESVLAAKLRGWNLFDDLKRDADLKNNAKAVAILDEIQNKDVYSCQPSIGFRSGQVYNSTGYPRKDGKGQQFVISAVLGVTRIHGSSPKQIVNRLRQSAKADYSKPKGTFYFVSNSGVRTTTRFPGFKGAVDALKTMGFKAEIVRSIPKNRDDLLGAMVGGAKFDWAQSNATCHPGAITENLTSFGGVLYKKTKQTPLTHFLKNGSAGSSGTVVEPYALQQKFPHPNLHVHYAAGCSLGEAFYQSVQCPFQLLIVGDPLCRPHASKLNFNVEGIDSSKEVSGAVSVKCNVVGNSPKLVEFYFDGRLQNRFTGLPDIRFDTKKMIDGDHVVELIAVKDSVVASKTRSKVEFTVKNKETDQRLLLTNTSVKSGEAIELCLESEELADLEMEVRFFSDLRYSGEAHSKLKLSTRKIGSGPIKLVVTLKKKNQAVLRKILICKIID